MNETLTDHVNESATSQTPSQTLADMPSFAEHVKKTNGERARRTLELAGVTELRKDDEKFDAALQELTRDGAYKWLMSLNGILRGTGKAERGVHQGMKVGAHIAPPLDVQGEILSDAVDAVKDIKDNHTRACLAYYTINYLHLFKDGNGRTSRAVYEIFDNPNFDLSGEHFQHKTTNQSESGDHSSFESDRNIRSANNAAWLSLAALKVDLAKQGKIPTALAGRAGLATIAGEDIGIYFTEDAVQNLTSEEKQTVNRFCADVDYAAVALGQVLQSKGTADDIIATSTNHYENGSSVQFEVTDRDLDNADEPNLAARKTFEGWTADDYRTFIANFKTIERQSQQKLIDIFKNPSEYPRTGGTNWADWLMYSNFARENGAK